MCSGSCLSPFKLALVFSSVQFSHSVMSDSLQPHEPQHARPPCPSPTARVYPYPCPLSRWCHPTISSSVVPFSSCPQSFPASGSFQMSQLFASGGQSTGVSASTSVLPVNTQDWSPAGWTVWISLQSKGLSRVVHVYFKFNNLCLSPALTLVNLDMRLSFCSKGLANKFHATWHFRSHHFQLCCVFRCQNKLPAYFPNFAQCFSVSTLHYYYCYYYYFCTYLIFGFWRTESHDSCMMLWQW